MKIIRTLLLLLIAVLGITACSDDTPSVTPLTGTQWELRNLTRHNSNSSTTVDIQLSFERNGRVVITAGYGSRTNVSGGSGSHNSRRQMETTLPTTYRYFNNSIRINPASIDGELGQILRGTEVLSIIEQLYTDATLNEAQTQLTFNPFDSAKRFRLNKVSR